MDSEIKLNWYAAMTRSNQEFFVKKKLDDLGVENFLPVEECIRETPFGRKRMRIPLIRSMIFVRTTRQNSFSLLNDYSLPMKYLRDFERHQALIVPDKQMQDFMFVLDVAMDGVEVLNKDLKRGDKVRIIKGPLCGLEGELIRVKGHKRVVIRLDGVASIATSYIPSSFLEKIG